MASYAIAKAIGMNVKDFNLIKGLVLMLVVPSCILFGVVYMLNLGSDPLRNAGAAAVIVASVKIAAVCQRYFRGRLKHRDPKSYGKWAIVTGCTGGLGQAYAHALAKAGMDLLLISRNPVKLEAEVKAIQAKYSVSCKILPYDFTDFDKADAFYRDLESMIKVDLKGQVGMLINNVGVGNEQPVYSYDLDPKLELDMIRINCEGTCRMTRAVLPLLVSNRKGAIINVSSGSGNHATPFLAVYSATKAFINQFSQSVAYEVKEFGIDVLGVHPYYVSGISHPSSFPFMYLFRTVRTCGSTT
jgi:short-subunit dehydrogenase